MQATFARKAFPCFDEPAMKAVFHVTLIHLRGTVALSNGRDVETFNTTIDGTEVTMTRFEPTKRMSTYLLAFIVSDFAHITGSIENNNVLVIQSNSLVQSSALYIAEVGSSISIW
uniref:Aminopeptidase N-like N-terminal domain-containing protein n=1 Tax=Hucho hucho TaxID=62062 RepID=A0A4W5LRJ2_9TELE